MSRPHAAWIAAVCAGAILAAGGYLHAQAETAEELPDVTAPADGEIDDLSADEKRDRSVELIDAMQVYHEHVVDLREVAREGRDVIKLNCVNEKLLEIKQLLNIAESSRSELVEAVALDDGDGQAHHFGQIAIALENTTGLREEAEACIGEDATFLGPTEVEVEGPDFEDDPTEESPFPAFEIEDPGYGSGYY